MFNMKYSIKLLSAIAFTTIIVTPVIACGGKPTYEKQYLNKVVAYNLGLLKKDGTPVYDVEIDNSPTTPNAFVWKLSSSLQINAASLLEHDGKAKDEESLVFIKNILGVKPNASAVFDRDILGNIVGELTTIEPKLDVASDKSGYAVVDGTFSLCFKTADDGQVLTYDYLIKILGDKKVDVTSDVLIEILNDIKVSDTNIPTNSSLNFEIGHKPADKNKINGTNVQLLSSSPNASVKKFFAFTTDFIPLFNINIIISDHKISDITWQKDDFLQVIFKDEKTNFDFLLKFKL